MNLSPAQTELVEKLHSNVKSGLTTDQVSDRRENEGFNVVKPPVDCPSWICCLLPCIKHVPSMKAFAQIRPEDAEILRNGKWIRYDASSLVTGDIIRLEEGDQVPADCIILSVEPNEILVDMRAVTGEDKPRSSKVVQGTQHEQAMQLFWGGTVVQGSGIAIVTATGVHTFVAGLIRDKKFPPTENLLLAKEENTVSAEDEGISLINRRETV
mmetsp:Transcript_6392/g.12787  ORF Transcript_6392/g.12787 Transcript_6392/m.12787 type:complete len:212 (-) Transcript_6392:146-781(-)